MSRTITSAMIPFVDLTDSRKIDIAISSNLPTVQIKNTNTGAFSPDWTSNNLVLQASVYLDSQDISSASDIAYTWYYQYGTGDEEPIFDKHTRSITINSNLDDVSGIVIYRCVATYQGITNSASITFNRSDSGENGSDGTSVKIIGVAYINEIISIGSYYTLYSDSECNTIIATEFLEDGDSYLVSGYLCVYDSIEDKFLCTGKIQGPPGNNGADAKQIILTSSAQIFKVNKNNTISPSSITITGTGINTSITSWLYSTDGGLTFVSHPPNGFVKNGNIITITGKDITSDSIVVKATDGTYNDTLSIFKVIDGTNGQDGSPGQSASIAFLTNENITFSANSQGQVDATIFTVNVVAYNGTTKVTPILDTITDIPTGMIIDPENITTSDNNEVIIPIVVNQNADFGSEDSNSGTINIPIISPISAVLKLNWSKINSGLSHYVHIRYRANEGETTLSTEPDAYMGVYSGTSETAPTDVSSYTWYDVKGESGAPGSDAIIFQIYSNNGYVLSKDLQEITLQTFAYKGSEAITSGATYQWASSTGGNWVNISGATQPYLNVVHSEVNGNKSYKCTMTFEELAYSYVVTVEDKSDIKQTFTSKPEKYSAGDIWIVGSDYIPNGIEVGTILRAEQVSNSYSDYDWVLATKYDKQVNDVVSDVEKYKQFFSVDTTTGITMAAIDAEGNRSPFSTNLSNTKLSFNQGSQEVAYISNNKLNITEAEIVSPLTVTGKYSGDSMLQAPTINIGSFSLIVESNGSLSIVSNI